MSELERMFESFKQELKDYKDLDSLEFLLKNQINFKDKVIKDYKVYLSDNEGEELLDYDEWIEEYKEENCDELSEEVNDFFTQYGIEQYESKYNYIWIINITGGGPHIDLEIWSSKETVTFRGRWGGDIFDKELINFYEIVQDIYNLPNN